MNPNYPVCSAITNSSRYDALSLARSVSEGRTAPRWPSGLVSVVCQLPNHRPGRCRTGDRPVFTLTGDRPVFTLKGCYNTAQGRVAHPGEAAVVRPSTL